MLRYIGKASNASRLNEYPRNVEKILAGKTRRPILKKDGLPQSRGNLRYRHVHLVLAIAENNGWLIEHHAIENADKENLNEREQLLINQYDCNMNNKDTWSIEEFPTLCDSFLKSINLN
ncbi:hypothetical protein [Psychromonas sp. Urea-02u-13]|uniref:hypothetical protein n=1 Tax=Psychromonas sp. Urea-02u-13 TaxID=2058326 RepID=UPI000C3398A2|nr:hypothetical protein [Psychromonas sp. Urea-02u-13]PKG37669.1 hypothetical protein CXF74_17640 [Psychromonas sp. Urea-02u-13]